MLASSSLPSFGVAFGHLAPYHTLIADNYDHPGTNSAQTDNYDASDEASEGETSDESNNSKLQIWWCSLVWPAFVLLNLCICLKKYLIYLSIFCVFYLVVNIYLRKKIYDFFYGFNICTPYFRFVCVMFHIFAVL